MTWKSRFDIGDVYLIEFWRKPNLFREQRTTSSTCGIDAWTGEVLINYRSKKGMQFYWIDEDSCKSADDMQRMKESIQLLDQRAISPVPLDSKMQSDFISPENAVSIATEKVQDRDYDHSREPRVVLVDDMYMVVFWRKEGDVALHHGKLYDSRVGIDAKTGNFVGTETTKDKRP